jgi:hypothetical protein
MGHKNQILWTGSLLSHPVLVKSPPGSSESHLGMISDRRLLAYFSASARSSDSATPPLHSTQPSSSFLRYVSNPLSSLPLPSLNLYFEVVAVHSSNSVLDAMRMMSDLGVSSVAVLEEEGGGLLSAISVTDIGQVCAVTATIPGLVVDNEFVCAQTVVPSQSNQILTMPIQQLVSQIKVRSGFHRGSFSDLPLFRCPMGGQMELTDIPVLLSSQGARCVLIRDHTVYSVFPSSTLTYTIQKLLASKSIDF